ncbi:MAG: DNA repair helicase XPB [Planctomycetota bacterium]|nr:DNA repair helicase XPB [Planctomycetota bacterium]
MATNPENPLIVQSDRSIILEADHPRFGEVRDRLMLFAELEKSPEHIHMYRITALSLWNAGASGADAGEILEFLEGVSKYPVPVNIAKEITEAVNSYGRLELISDGRGGIVLTADEDELLERLGELSHIEEFLLPDVLSEKGLPVRPECRGQLKLVLAKLGYPARDLAGYREGKNLAVELGETLPDGEPFGLRSYQRDAVEAFYAGGSEHGGSGVVVLPCGAGKTIVGMGALAAVGKETLILTTNVTALRQWRRELLEKTTLTEDQVGEYSGEVKQIRQVTLSTYQMLTYRKSKVDDFEHFKLFFENKWGLIIYDEVHLLPAPVFRFTAEIQATRRLGLTATLIREDGKEKEVFSLIGPRKYDVPWRSLEGGGWIADAECVEVRVELDPELKEDYQVAGRRGKFRIASENPAKMEAIKNLVRRHADDHILILGQYLDQLQLVADELGAPLITGKTPQQTRDELYGGFRSGEIRTLVVSKVGNFAVDLPDANVAIQISGTFGSRQEEAQRLGRILRPKQNSGCAVFYSLVTRGSGIAASSREQEFAEKRQLFLTEQGYPYRIMEAEELVETVETVEPERERAGTKEVQCS